MLIGIKKVGSIFGSNVVIIFELLVVFQFLCDMF